MAGNTTRPTQGNITKSRIRIILAAEYGQENVRITRGGEIHIRGQMPNTDQDGWYLWGQIGNPDSEARLRQLPGAALSQSDAEQPDARNPERLRVIATTLADVSAELDGIADTLAAGMEGRS